MTHTHTQHFHIRNMSNESLYAIKHALGLPLSTEPVKPTAAKRYHRVTKIIMPVFGLRVSL